MRHTSKNRSQWKKIGHNLKNGHNWKRGHAWKNGSHLKEGSPVEKWVKRRKMDHIQ